MCIVSKPTPVNQYSILFSTHSVNTLSGDGFIHFGNILLRFIFHFSSTTSSHQLNVFFKTQQCYRHSKYSCHAVLKQHKPRSALFWLAQTDPFLAFLTHHVLFAQISQLENSSSDFYGVLISLSWNVSHGLLRFVSEMGGLVAINGVGQGEIWGKVAED